MRHRSVTYSGRGGGRGTPRAAATAETGFANRDAAFNALADPTRRAVLDLLRAGTRPAGEIARAFPVSRPAISKHLRILRRAHLVEERREGRHRLYQRLAAEHDHARPLRPSKRQFPRLGDLGGVGRAEDLQVRDRQEAG